MFLNGYAIVAMPELRTMGFEVAKIVQAANNQKRALDTYVKVNETATAKAITDSEAQIRALNEKIAELDERRCIIRHLFCHDAIFPSRILDVLVFCVKRGRFQMSTPPADSASHHKFHDLSECIGISDRRDGWGLIAEGPARRENRSRS